jgi:hypothetical protein
MPRVTRAAIASSIQSGFILTVFGSALQALILVKIQIGIELEIILLVEVYLMFAV